MKREMIFLDEEARYQLTLPVTPSSFQVSRGIRVETVNIYEAGERNIAGAPTLASIPLDCVFPANPYPFASPQKGPYDYIEDFRRWSHGRRTVRFIVTDTGINLPVLVESIKFGERDGTNDVYASLLLREQRGAEPARSPGKTGENRVRASGNGDTGEKDYKIAYGDTLSSICRKFYGDGSARMYTALAKENGIANPHLIFEGDVIRLPERSRLMGGI